MPNLPYFATNFDFSMLKNRVLTCNHANNLTTLQVILQLPCSSYPLTFLQAYSISLFRPDAYHRYVQMKEYRFDLLWEAFAVNGALLLRIILLRKRNR